LLAGIPRRGCGLGKLLQFTSTSKVSNSLGTIRPRKNSAVNIGQTYTVALSYINGVKHLRSCDSSHVWFERSFDT